jgi:hypothetical protein
MDQDRMVRMSDPERLEALPEHEDDSDVEETGSGILSQGDTSIDRGTGTTYGTAQPRRGEDGELPDRNATTEQLAAYDRGASGSIPRGQSGGGLPEAAFVTDEPERDPEEEGPATGLRSG